MANIGERLQNLRTGARERWDVTSTNVRWTGALVVATGVGFLSGLAAGCGNKESSIPSCPEGYESNTPVVVGPAIRELSRAQTILRDRIEIRETPLLRQINDEFGSQDAEELLGAFCRIEDEVVLSPDGEALAGKLGAVDIHPKLRAPNQ